MPLDRRHGALYRTRTRPVTGLDERVAALNGAVAEWLRSGLQSRLHRFDSGPRLQTPQLMRGSKNARRLLA